MDMLHMFDHPMDMVLLGQDPFMKCEGTLQCWSVPTVKVKVVKTNASN